ncbi:MAG: PTS IIA-like nitrogen regulatory protein PtsN [Emcibacteraceae bacterium]|uniref:PTS IIA-like nitrogen regulatory protein PtsN n=1 Tax=Pseudemcibacter sp. TaxID=2943293 RepID=UPI003F6964F7|nr:PTS IIA-like nitrogen regulatory protein PtsN [Emcibacteraceae bacterium]MDG1727421.1 PTS IIA-like nitrogen regulatory protein PtsN [Emcibacteraceae bacterium]
MELSNLINLETIYPNMKASSKKQLLQELGTIVKDKIGKPIFEIASVLMERERLGSTGVGHGVAIPHGRFSELDQICGVFVKLDKPVNYDSIDDQPVDLIFLLLAPEEAGADHLKALAKISRIFRDQATCAKLRGADNSDAIYAILNSVQ